jgi:tripartite-type tricarboxylate transporter receptor subunit TctC
MIARRLAAGLSASLGQPVNVQNREGVMAKFDVGSVVRAATNGYTFVVTSNAVLIDPMIASRPGYDPLIDFDPIAYFGAAPNVIVTTPSSGITSLDDLIQKAKAAPGALTYASPGSQTSSHLVMEFLKLRSKTDLRHIPLNGSDGALTGLLANAADLASVSATGLLPYIQSGKIIPLAQTGKKRLSALPNVPTLLEAGFPNGVAETSVMFLAPAKTPNFIVAVLANRSRWILSDLADDLLKDGFVVSFEGPDELRKRMKTEIRFWKEVVDRADIRKK